MLECLLKQGNSYFSLYWINGTISSVVTSNIFSKRIASQILNFPVHDAHTTYPQDGNVHMKYASQKNQGKKESFLIVSKNQLSFKQILDSQQTKQNFNSMVPLENFTPPPGYPLEYYSTNDNAHFFFGTKAFNLPIPIEVANEILDPKQDKSWQEENTVIIDTNNLGKVSINVSGYIANTNFVLPEKIGPIEIHHKREKTIKKNIKLVYGSVFN